MLIHQTENCSETRWRNPVMVQLRFGFPEEIDGPLKALNCLVYRWPVLGGEDYSRAKEMCMAALGGRIPCGSARTAFVAAAKEAEALAGAENAHHPIKRPQRERSAGARSLHRP
ncbi:DUF982 domain-containing protein [Pararhizobium sp. BT-229]|uniref:DUF982 domain-containing protein n=1 Tax=Pararhizobium sp. BT-229 TaxID=2986923 RepID=UPI0021F78FEC|nr:DUF982 domain-containing protein [Pararhizobium sp. BT-229]MCV9967010.1 DUF982 domain-containing protein [Pararhizobium sp. BT-229]